MVIGPSMAGKTVLTLDILRNAAEMYTVPPKNIIYAFGVYQKVFTQLETELNNITFHEGLPTKEMIESLGSEEEEDHSLVVIDDLMDEICKSAEMCALFTRDVHHRRISVIMITQNIYHQSKYSRTISLNTSYLILMKTCRDLQQIHHLSRQMFPSTPKRLLEAYEDTTRRPRGYLVVNNLTGSGDEDIHLSTNILPEDSLVLYTRK
jgi:hypothetical protein